MAPPTHFNQKISPFVESQVPAFFLEDYPQFVNFIKEYYIWLEDDGNAWERLARAEHWMDVDDTLAAFIKNFKSRFLSGLPSGLYPNPNDLEATCEANADSNNPTVDDATVIKYSRQFFQSKGTPDAVKYLFRILYNETASITSPAECDDTTTTTTTTTHLKLKNPTAGSNIYELAGQVITGATSGTQATIDKIRELSNGNERVHDLTVTLKYGASFTDGETVTGPTKLVLDTDVVGIFNVGDIVQTADVLNKGIVTKFDSTRRELFIDVTLGSFADDDAIATPAADATATINGTPTQISESLSLGLTGVTFHLKGENYKVGDFINVISTTGSGAVARVATLNDEGGALTATIKLAGSGYATTDTLSLSHTGNAQATAIPTFASTETNTRTYTKLSQPLYEYMIRVARSIKQYRDIVKRTVHPAGMKFTGLYPFNATVDESSNVSIATAQALACLIPTIEQYGGYEIGDYESIVSHNPHPNTQDFIGIPSEYWWTDELVGLAGDNPYRNFFKLDRTLVGQDSAATAKVAQWSSATLKLEDPADNSSSSNSSSSLSSESSSSSTLLNKSSSSSSNSSSSTSNSSSSTEAMTTSSSSSSNSSSSNSSSSQSSAESSSSSSSTDTSSGSSASSSSSSTENSSSSTFISESSSSEVSFSSSSTQTSSSSSLTFSGDSSGGPGAGDGDGGEPTIDSTSSSHTNSSSSQSESSSSSTEVSLSTQSSSSSTEVSLTSDSSQSTEGHSDSTEVLETSSASSPSSNSSSSSSSIDGQGDFNIRVVRIPLRTTDGTQDFTVGDFGNCKAAYFQISDAVTNDTAIDGIEMSIGATDGTNQLCIWKYAPDNEAAPGTAESQAFSNRVLSLDEGSTSATFDSFITDGVRLNILNDGAPAHLLTVTLFGGIGLNAKVDHVALGTQDTKVAYTGLGFEPEVMLCFNNQNRFSVNQSSSSQADLTTGVLHNTGGTVIQRSISTFVDDDPSPTDPAARLRTNGVGGELTVAGAEAFYADFEVFHADGFDAYARAGNGTNKQIGFLALSFDGTANIHLGTTSSPIATGTDDRTDPGFEPMFDMISTSSLIAQDTATTGAAAGTHGVFVYDGQSQFTNSASFQDNVATTNTKTLAADSLHYNLDIGTTAIDADMTFLPTGRRLNVTFEALSTANLWVELMIGYGADASSSSTVASVTSSSSTLSESSPSSNSSSSSTEALNSSSSSTADDFLTDDLIYQGTSYSNSHRYPGLGNFTAKVKNDGFDETDASNLTLSISNMRGEIDLTKNLHTASGKVYRIRRALHHLGVNTISGTFSENERVLVKDSAGVITDMGATIRKTAINSPFDCLITRYFLKACSPGLSDGPGIHTSTKYGESSSSSSTDISTSSEDPAANTSASSPSSESTASSEVTSSESSSSQSSGESSSSSSTLLSTQSSSSSSTIVSLTSASSESSSSSTVASLTSSSSSTLSSDSSSDSSLSSSSTEISESSTSEADTTSSASSSSTAVSFTSSSSSTICTNSSNSSSSSESSSSQSSRSNVSSSSTEQRSSSSTAVESTSSNSSSSQSSDNEFIEVMIFPAYYINSEDPNPILISEQERVDLSGIGVLDNNGEIQSADFDNDQKSVVSYLAQREYWKKVKAGTFSNANNLTDAEIDVIIADMDDLLNIEIQSSSSSGTAGETGFDDDNFDVSSGSSDSSLSSAGE